MVSERDLLARRLLRLMEPGQYLAHATTTNYDPATDPLIELKRREVRVENEKRELQEARNQPKRARELDLEQTLDEQAYASGLASRWRFIDRPHIGKKPTWEIIGFLLDEDSEQYVRTLVEKRIARIEQELATEAAD